MGVPRSLHQHHGPEHPRLPCGLPTKSFDGRGNYAIGIPDQSIFPEIELDQIKRNIGFDIIFVTSAPTDEEGRDLLAELGIPFRKPNKKTEEKA